MRLYNTPFFLVKIDFEHLPGSVDDCCLIAFDRDLVELPMKQTIENNVRKIELNIQLPNKLIIRSSHSNDQVKVKKFNLAGIDVDKDKLLQCSEYRLCDQESINSFGDFANFEATKTLDWARSGYMIVDLFHPNPFAWHLYIGNKIKIYQDQND